MKYVITETQLYRAVFRYLDIHRYKTVETEENIYFMEFIDGEFSDITYDKKHKFCSVDTKLLKLVTAFFSLPPDLKEAKVIIGKWVKYTLQMEVNNVWPSNKGGITALRVEK